MSVSQTRIVQCDGDGGMCYSRFEDSASNTISKTRETLLREGWSICNEQYLCLAHTLEKYALELQKGNSKQLLAWCVQWHERETVWLTPNIFGIGEGFLSTWRRNEAERLSVVGVKERPLYPFVRLPTVDEQRDWDAS